MSWLEMNKKCRKSKSENTNLEKQGWKKRFAADEPDLREAVELYKSLGYEVKFEPVVFDEKSGECKKCLLHQNFDRYKTIYIRPKKKRGRHYSLTLQNL
ncbi:MAG: hypothetical protein OEY22_05205 [Candidatus Bathyarchaeota archaeon]|nr:hypothetical protein [Candidatus Bathyarchaeota archaeon]MDH5787287.1 hypothetical protein [Candidatus Bathyarchaeota archaeon]